MKRFALSLAIASVVPVMFWCGGFDFDERGLAASLCAFYALAVGIASWCWLGIGR